MNKITRKILFIVLAVCLPTLLIGQTLQTEGINSEEKKRLEEKFKALKTFYIDDDGVVVYYPAGTTPTHSNNQKQTKAADPMSDVTVKVSLNDEGEYVVSSNSQEFNQALSSTPVTEPSKETVTTENTFSFPEPEDVKPVVTEKIETEIVKESTNPFIIKKAEKIEVADETVKEFTEEQIAEEQEAPVQSPGKLTGTKYKTLEEAAMAVDATLELLKKQQAQNQAEEKGGASSLSRMITGSVGGALRKSNPYKFDGENLNESGAASTETESQDYNNGEPTYYINGVRVEQSEVEKLKQKDIIRKERKRSKSNPNGEEWIETR